MRGTATKLQTARNIKIQGAVSGNADFDGNKDIVINVVQDNIAEIAGTLTIGASDSEKKTINYPGGFTCDNCYVISCGIRVIENKGYNFIGSYTNSSDALDNAYNRKVNLTNSDIKLAISNPNTNAMTVEYKILLIKK